MKIAPLNELTKADVPYDLLENAGSPDGVHDIIGDINVIKIM